VCCDLCSDSEINSQQSAGSGLLRAMDASGCPPHATVREARFWLYDQAVYEAFRRALDLLEARR
jgi:hypothetical protein